MSHGPRLIHGLLTAERALKRIIDARSAELPGEHRVGAAGAGVLFAIPPGGHASAKDIARAIGASPAGTSGLLNRMEAAGLLRREPEPADARAVRVTLTSSGESARAHARGVLNELNPRLEQGFTDYELAVVARWLDHVRRLESSDAVEP